MNLKHCKKDFQPWIDFFRKRNNFLSILSCQCFWTSWLLQGTAWKGRGTKGWSTLDIGIMLKFTCRWLRIKNSMLVMWARKSVKALKYIHWLHWSYTLVSLLSAFSGEYKFAIHSKFPIRSQSILNLIVSTHDTTGTHCALNDSNMAVCHNWLIKQSNDVEKEQNTNSMLVVWTRKRFRILT